MNFPTQCRVRYNFYMILQADFIFIFKICASDKLSAHVRNGNSFFTKSSMVSVLCLEVYGPKYIEPSRITLLVKNSWKWFILNTYIDITLAIFKHDIIPWLIFLIKVASKSNASCSVSTKVYSIWCAVLTRALVLPVICFYLQNMN